MNLALVSVLLCSVRPAWTSCPDGPCETPRCCNSGMLIKEKKDQTGCEDRGCFDCLTIDKRPLSQNEECSYDSQIQKSFCMPGLSCFIECDQGRASLQIDCQHQIGTCLPTSTNMSTTSNATVLTGIEAVKDVIHVEKCFEEHFVCRCASACVTTGSGKPWCLLGHVHDPIQPHKHCYSDVKWSKTRGSFFSTDACNDQVSPISPQTVQSKSWTAQEVSNDVTNNQPQSPTDQPVNTQVANETHPVLSASVNKMMSRSMQQKKVLTGRAHLKPSSVASDEESSDDDDFYWNFKTRNSNESGARKNVGSFMKNYISRQKSVHTNRSRKNKYFVAHKAEEAHQDFPISSKVVGERDKETDGLLQHLMQLNDTQNHSLERMTQSPVPVVQLTNLASQQSNLQAVTQQLQAQERRLPV